MNNYIGYIVLAALCVLTISWAIPFQENAAINQPERVKIALRQVGNELLLSNNDSTSLILPVKQIHEKSYQLRFERNVTFLPDSLVDIIDKNFAKANISKNYIVEVLRCEDLEVSYSYEMNMNWDKTIVPCIGRQVPDACHIIEINFITQEATLSATKVSVAMISLGLLLFLGFRFRESVKKTSPLKDDIPYISLGIFQFFPTQHNLTTDTETVALSKKECELLEIFAKRPNEVIKREELTKTVWEDNGVIVGRSLDTYISKLRNKLKADTSLTIKNVHGVGYQLEIPLV